MSVSNPLTPGVYRIDLPCELASVFGGWRRAQKGRVQILELDNAPGGRARVTFVVFNRPGAFPFGKLGKPTVGELVGAMPDWTDVVALALLPMPALQVALEGQAMIAFLAEHTAAEFAPLRDAIAVARANMAIIRMQLGAVKNGTSINPSAALQNASQLVRQSIELIVQAGGAIPGNFARHVVNKALSELHELAEAIATAPQKALAAVAKFASDAASTVALPFSLEALAVVGLAAGGLMAWTEKKVTPTSRNLILAGAAAGVAAGFVGTQNVMQLFDPKGPATT